MHLAAQADAGDLFALSVTFLEQLAYGALAGFPPIVRILLGPTASRRCKRLVFVDSRCDDRAAFVDQQGARSPGADIDPQ
jgi:hypothetical protein